MSRITRIYLIVVAVLIVGWFVARAGDIAAVGRLHRVWILLAVAGLYLLSHGCRMLRLALLTLDERKQTAPLLSAHALTAFPSSFLPFKIGEILRLAAFVHVYDRRRKAVAIWMVERFGDVAVLATFIIGLQVFHLSVPQGMQAICAIFVIASLASLVTLFAVSKIFVYLNRYLVLTSHTSRGLFLLRASYAFRLMELDVRRCIEGRFVGFLLGSVVIWIFEILALSLFFRYFSTEGLDFPLLFLHGLIASLPGGHMAGAGVFGLYQSLALAALTTSFVIGCGVLIRLKSMRDIDAGRAR